MTVNSKTMHDGVVGCNVILVFLGLERIDKDGMYVSVSGLE